jgi:F0F1-type ATP synthase membrane subunit c/vacuolar-type H+-ATPase subunit K
MPKDSHSNMPYKTNYTEIGIAIGVAIGMSLGVALFATTDNLALLGGGLPIGITIGVAIGAALERPPQATRLVAQSGSLAPGPSSI